MLVIHEMKKIFEDFIGTLSSLSPKDADFRKKIIGAPFWAEGQEYKLVAMTYYTGVLVHYTIRRGGVSSHSTGAL